MRNRHDAGCRVAVERAADRYTLICDEPTNLTDDKVEGSFLVVGDTNKIVGAVYEDGTPT